MEREVTPARSRAVSSVRPTPCVLWLPACDTPPAHLVKSLENLGLRVIVARHRYAALAEAIVATTAENRSENQQPASPGTTPTSHRPIAVVLVEPDRLVGVDSFRDALSRLQTPIARWRFDPAKRPAFARDEPQAGTEELAPTDGTANARSETTQSTHTDTQAAVSASQDPHSTDSPNSTSQTPAANTPPGWLRLVHDDELSEPNRPGDRPEDHQQHQPPRQPRTTPGTPESIAPQPRPAIKPAITPPEHTPPDDHTSPPPERITLTDDELAMLLADDDEFRRLEQRHANRPPPQQPNHRPTR